MCFLLAIWHMRRPRCFGGNSVDCKRCVKMMHKSKLMQSALGQFFCLFLGWFFIIVGLFFKGCLVVKSKNVFRYLVCLREAIAECQGCIVTLGLSWFLILNKFSTKWYLWLYFIRLQLVYTYFEQALNWWYVNKSDILRFKAVYPLRKKMS